MRVLVTADSVSLDQPDDFAGFVAVSDLEGAALGDALASAGAGTFTDDHVFVDVEWLRARILDAGVEDGADKLGGMLAYAATKGWISADGAGVQAHVEKP